MKSQNTKSSAILKHEVREELKKVERGLDDLQGRLTPGQILDDIIFYPNGASPKRTIEYLKNNPIGTSFLTMGTVLLMEDKESKSFEKRIKNKVEEGTEALKEKAADPRISEAKNKVQNMKKNFKSKVDDIRREISKKIPSQETIEGIDSRNLLVLGMGLGAMTGASVPLTEKEKEFFHSGKMDSELGQFDRELREALNESTNTLKNRLVRDVGSFDLNLF